MVERDVGGERVNELVLSHERIVRGFRVSIRHVFFVQREMKMAREIGREFRVVTCGFRGSETNLSSQVDRW